MNKILLFALCLYCIGTLASGKKQEKKQYAVNRNYVEGNIKNPFKDYPLKHKSVKKTLEQYFKNAKYRVILSYPLGVKEEICYLAVEEAEPEKYYNVIKKGVFVWEDGSIHAYLDPNKGIWTVKKELANFQQLGIAGEIQYFIIGSNHEFQKGLDNRRYLRVHGSTDVMSLYIGLIDRSGNIISNLTPTADLFILSISIQRESNDDLLYLFGFDSDEDEMKRVINEFIKPYKINKAKGKTIKPAALKSEYERLKKAGMVQGE